MCSQNRTDRLFSMRRCLLAALSILVIFISAVHAQSDEGDDSYAESDIEPANEPAAGQTGSSLSSQDSFVERANAENDSVENKARRQQADQNFDAIMVQNAEIAGKKAGVLGFMGKSAQADAYGSVFGGDMPAASPVATLPPLPSESKVEVPLKLYDEFRNRINQIREAAGRRQAPSVVLGASEFTGEARRGSLALQEKLQVTLGRPDRWKVVPLVGDETVLVKATVDGQPIPISSQNGYHVWVTQRTGEVTILLDLLVPARGPRGSIEYDFLIARTPVTRFVCFFPWSGLEPRLDTAIQSAVLQQKGGTKLEATLHPTTRMHLVGFKETGDREEQKAKVYAESLNLLSVDEGSLDLFMVVRYTILYAGNKDFTVQIPKGMKVVSADGEGAFRWVLQGDTLKGETAFPIRNNYEISLRLHREIAKGGEAFDAPLPRCLGVEREMGWLAVEVPGKLKLDEEKKEQVMAVDVRQIPPEMVNNAVSPIKLAYRYHTSAAKVRLVATRLPEKEPASASVDRVRAITQISKEGGVQTELRITLRNRLRHSLNLVLARGDEVLSATLDGQPVKPSLDDQGRIVLPLKRSSGQDRLRPFTLQVTLSSSISSLGWFGHPTLALPSLDLPVSSLTWSVYFPANNRYSRLRGDIDPQTHAGMGSWHQTSAQTQTFSVSGVLDSGILREGGAGRAGTGESGAMPVRMNVEESGVRLDYTRYWIESGRSIGVSFFYLRSWLRYPIMLLLGLLAAFGCWSALWTWRSKKRRWMVGLEVALFVLASWPLYHLGRCFSVCCAGLLGILFFGYRLGWNRKIVQEVAEWLRTIKPRLQERIKNGEKLTPGQMMWKIIVGVGLGVFFLVFLSAFFKFLLLLASKSA